MEPSSSDPSAVRLEALTEREKETLRLLLRGHDAKSIARDLGLSIHTINERLRDARRKLGVSSSREAARRLASGERGGPKKSADKNLGVVQEPAEGRGFGAVERGRNSGRRLAWLVGGMLVMSLIIGAAALMLASEGHNGTAMQANPPAALTAASSKATDPAAVDAAQAWLALLDNHLWAQSWGASGDPFRLRVSAEQWTSMVQPIRQPLGAVSSRTVQSATRASSLPGAPVGDYEILQFQTNFASKPGAVETVVLAREGGSWKVSGYFIR